MNIPLALLWFLIGFVAVNGLKVLHLNRQWRRAADAAPLQPKFQQQAYQKILPFIPVYYLIVWILCSTFYFLLHNAENIYIDAIQTGVLWWMLTLLLEMVIWVKTNHKFTLTWKEMYVHSQPWISISYYAVLISPLVLSLILR